MEDRYDIVVVGAGPAGSTAARVAAEAGTRVLLLEKDREVGLPVRCAEGVGSKGLCSVVEIRPEWIAQKIAGAVMHAPSGDEVTIYTDDLGIVLHRKIFDYDLARMAARSGARILTKAYVSGLVRENGDIRGVVIELLGAKHQIKADVIIGADGVESRVGRWVGLKTKTTLKDMETCAQVTACNVNVEADFCHFFFSSRLAPGGYAWIFPKGENMANIGLGISGEYSGQKRAWEYLHDFLKSHFPDASPLTSVVGGIPCTKPLKEIATDHVMIIGDAAHQANSLSGGGIVTSMIAGKIAGEVAAAAIKEKDTSQRRLQEYEQIWHKTEGAKLNKFYQLKKFIYSLSDEKLDKIAEAVLKLPPEKRTLVNIFKAALINKPSLLLNAVKLFT